MTECVALPSIATGPSFQSGAQSPTAWMALSLLLVAGCDEDVLLTVSDTGADAEIADLAPRTDSGLDLGFELDLGAEPDASSKPDSGGGTSTEALIAYYPFSGSFDDVSGNGHHGASSSASFTTDRFGMMGQAAAFEGTAYIEVDDDPQLDLSETDFTIAFWVRYDDESTAYLVSHSEGPGSRAKWIIHGSRSRLDLVTLRTGWVGLGNPDFELGRFGHVAFRRRGTQLDVFVDGLADTRITIPATLSNPTAAMTFGWAEFDRPARALQGALDELRIYGRALLDGEIAALVHRR